MKARRQKYTVYMYRESDSRLYAAVAFLAASVSAALEDAREYLRKQKQDAEQFNFSVKGK